MGVIGRYIRMDQVTKEKADLRFARVLVEVKINQTFPECIHFKNEHGCVITQKVYYQWTPIRCLNCKGYGHGMEECVKHQKGKQKWVVKKQCNNEGGIVERDNES